MHLLCSGELLQIRVPFEAPNWYGTLIKRTAKGTPILENFPYGPSAIYVYVYIYTLYIYLYIYLYTHIYICIYICNVLTNRVLELQGLEGFRLKDVRDSGPGV